MVFIFGDFGVYTKDADEVETIIKKHNHIDYKKVVYEDHIDMFNMTGRVSMTWFEINGCCRKDFEGLFEDLNKSNIRIALTV